MLPARITARAADLTIAATWVAVALLVWPAGEFPLNDDWAWAGAVRTLVADGGRAVGSTPEEFAAFMKADTDKWTRLAKTISIVKE